jgi:hypothetical protein
LYEVSLGLSRLKRQTTDLKSVVRKIVRNRLLPFPQFELHSQDDPSADCLDVNWCYPRRLILICATSCSAIGNTFVRYLGLQQLGTDLLNPHSKPSRQSQLASSCALISTTSISQYARCVTGCTCTSLCGLGIIHFISYREKVFRPTVAQCRSRRLELQILDFPLWDNPHGSYLFGFVPQVS